MVADIFQVISDAITNMISALTSALEGVVPLFYEAGTGTASGHFTFLGVLLLIAVGVAIVYWAIRLVMGLVRRA